MTAIPDKVDLAIIVVPTHLVPHIVRECADKSVKGIVLITAGFKEAEDEVGAKLQNDVAAIANEFKIKIIGPNTFGMINLHADFNASFTPEFYIEEFISKHAPEDVRENRMLDAALRWLIYESVQTLIDSCNHVVASLKLGIAETYKDSMMILADHRLMEEVLTRTIIDFISLRNRLVHRYRYVTSEELYEKAKELTESLTPKFRECIYEVSTRS